MRAVWGITEITKGNVEAVFGVFFTNQRYFVECEGKEITPADIERCISDAPPDFPLGNKAFVGVRRNGAVVAVVDLLLGYPTDNDVYLGLLLVHGDTQGKGYGGRITDALIKTARRCGFESVHLAVLTDNAKGLGFWKRRGFAELKQSIVRHGDGGDLMVVSMKKSLT